MSLSDKSTYLLPLSFIYLQKSTDWTDIFDYFKAEVIIVD